MMIFVVQVLPPIRNKKKKKVQKPVIKKEKYDINTKRIKSSDYAAWNKFDVVSSLIFFNDFYLFRQHRLCHNYILYKKELRIIIFDD